MSDWWFGFCVGGLFSWAGMLFNDWMRRRAQAMVARHKAERRAELERLVERTEARGGPRA